MGISERRERERTERRNAILNCARELVLAQGVEHINMEDIAAKAELSKATVYLYFSSKEELLSEICEEAARKFCEHLKMFSAYGLKGITALKFLWRGYVELFGSFSEMVIIFQVRNYLDSWMPIVSLDDENEENKNKDKKKSTNVETILSTIKNIIDECKEEGVFAPDLDSTVATRLVLSIFSKIIEHASNLPMEVRGSPAVVDEMINTFQIIIRGFGREGISYSVLDIRN